MILTNELDRFIHHLSTAKQPSTVRRYRYDLQQFISWLKKYRKDSETKSIPKAEEVTAYYIYLKQEADYAPSTIRRILAVMRQWFLFTEQYELVIAAEGFIKETKVSPLKNDVPFLLPEEIENLFKILASNTGLTENQIKYRHLIRVRNEVIFRLILNYGLTIQELTNLTLDHIHFSSNELEIISRKGKKRKRIITAEDRKKMFEYYMTIPEAVRPNRYDNASFLIAFDYQRGTYRWDYSKDLPKNLSEVAVQKMIRHEMKRAGFPPHKSAQQLRKTYILNQMLQGVSKESLRNELAFETTQPLDELAGWAAYIKERGPV